MIVIVDSCERSIKWLLVFSLMAGLVILVFHQEYMFVYFKHIVNLMIVDILYVKI